MIVCQRLMRRAALSFLSHLPPSLLSLPNARSLLSAVAQVLGSEEECERLAILPQNVANCAYVLCECHPTC